MAKLIHTLTHLATGRRTSVARRSLAVLLLAGISTWPALRWALLLLAGVTAWATGAALGRVATGLLGRLAVLAWRRRAVLALTLAGRGSTVLALTGWGSAVLALGRRAVLALRGPAKLSAGRGSCRGRGSSFRLASRSCGRWRQGGAS